MKILWLLDFLPTAMSKALGLPPQASGTWASTLYTALGRGEADLVFCSYTGEVARPERRELDGTVYLALPKSAGKPALETVLHTEQPDLVQLFGTENDHALWLFECFDPARVLVYVQGLAAPCGEHMADGLPARFLRAQPLKEAIAGRTGGATIYQLKQALTRRGERETLVLRQARHILGRTEWDRAYCAALNPEAEYHQLNEIMRAPFYAGGWRRADCTPHRLFVSQGNLPLKGVHWAVEALPALAAAFPDTQLYMAGWPPPEKGPLLRPFLRWLAEYQGYVCNLADRLGVADRVHYTGVLNAQQMKDQFLQCETYLLCSSIENSPNSLGEAMLLGLPCAAAAVGGVPSMLQDGKEGVLFNPLTPGALAGAVLRLWQNPGQAQAMGEAARARALKDHDGPAVAARLVQIYRQVLAAPSC